MPTPSERFVTAARGYLGVPFRWHGRDRSGLDCWGLIVTAACDAFGSTWDYQDYPMALHSALVFRNIKNYAKRISGLDATHGDITVVKWSLGVFHMGIISSPTTRIHADHSIKKVVECAWPYEVKPLSFYRLPEVING